MLSVEWTYRKISTYLSKERKLSLQNNLKLYLHIKYVWSHWLSPITGVVHSGKTPGFLMIFCHKKDKTMGFLDAIFRKSYDFCMIFLTYNCVSSNLFPFQFYFKIPNHVDCQVGVLNLLERAPMLKRVPPSN